MITFNAGTHRDVVHMRTNEFRRLVRPTVEVSAAEVEQSVTAEFGPTARIRMITVANQARAVEIGALLVLAAMAAVLASARRRPALA